MVRYRIRAGKDRTSFSILTLAIAEEERIGSRIIMSKLAGLTNEATGEGDTVLNTGSAGNDEIISYDTNAYMNRGMNITVDASILKTRCTLYLAVISDLDILDIAGISDGHSRADISGT
jgi:hypothetical protein